MLSIAFYLQTDGQTKKQNSTMKIYPKFLSILYKTNRYSFFLMAKFAYNNAKNANISHTSFELNYGYYPCILYEENLDLHLKSKIMEKLSF